MWIVDRTGGECSKTVFRHKHGRSVHCSTDRIIVHTVVHASRRPRTPAPGSGTTHASHRAPRRAPHTRATERRALGALASAPRAGVRSFSLLRSCLRVGCGLTSAIRPRFHVSGTELYRRCTARYVGYSLYRARRRSELYTWLYRGRAEPQRTLSGTGRQCVRSETIHIGSLHITAVSVTCVRWTARV